MSINFKSPKEIRSSNKYKYAVPRRGTAPQSGACKVCLKQLKDNSLFCSKECSSLSKTFTCPTCFTKVIKPKIYTSHFCSLGCRQGKHPTKSINKLEVFSTLGSSCLICDSPVDMFMPAGLDYSPTIDHVVPLSLGGSNDLFNAAPAHRLCNHLKGCEFDMMYVHKLHERLYGGIKRK